MKPRVLIACIAAGLPLGALNAEPVLPEARGAVESHLDAREVAGAVTLVGDKESILHLDAQGSADVAAERAMAEDAIFWVASMTKPVTGTAVMMLVEEGKLALDDSVATYVPELARLKDAEGNEVVVTIRQCLTHTAGLSEVSGEETKDVTTLAELMPLIADKPVQFQPGSEWRYTQTGINTAARVVEVVSGEAFPEFLEKRLFGPLGMKDTTFYLSESQLPRLAASYRRSDAGELEETRLFFLGGRSPVSRDRYPMANGGLFSTVGDFAKFGRMILRGGELGGTRYLKPETVKTMTAVHTGDLEPGFTPGNGWGIGWCVVRDPQGPTAALSPGSFGHGGAYGTQFWIDPAKERFYLLMVQRANFPNSDASDLRRDFQNAAAAALDAK